MFGPKWPKALHKMIASGDQVPVHPEALDPPRAEAYGTGGSGFSAVELAGESASGTIIMDSGWEWNEEGMM